MIAASIGTEQRAMIRERGDFKSAATAVRAASTGSTMPTKLGPSTAAKQREGAPKWTTPMTAMRHLLIAARRRSRPGRDGLV